jgi:oxygen-independent coproporphyrinogen-3 oxidase
VFRFQSLPPLSLYIHIPWCVRKCPYCDFNSHAIRDGLPEAAYADALLRDLESQLPRVWGRRLETVFIGGGTPSLFAPETMDRLLSGLRARLPLRPDAEITLEANPGTVEQGRFRELRAAGINRLSIGIQSFDDGLLRGIGRIHDGREARAAAEAAHAAGFDNLNLDLMFALPGQGLEQALADLDTAMALEPTHLSWYQLTIEPNTAFHQQPPPLPDDEQIHAMQEAGQAILAAHGFTTYEVSAHARAGRRCRHNLNYWRFGDYLGIGAGAHGKISLPDAILRTRKPRHPRDYLQTPGQTDERPLGPGDASLEFMMNALRLVDGFETDLFHRHTGLDTLPEEALSRARELELLERDGSRIRPTELGRRFLNDLLGLFA